MPLDETLGFPVISVFEGTFLNSFLLLIFLFLLFFLHFSATFLLPSSSFFSLSSQVWFCLPLLEFYSFSCVNG